jgi:hypothetical protein
VSGASEEDADRPRSDVSEDDLHHLFWRVLRPSVAMILSDAAHELFPMISGLLMWLIISTSDEGIWMLRRLGMVRLRCKSIDDAGRLDAAVCWR